MPSSQMTTIYDLGYNGYRANFKMIENYIYLHHVNKFIVLPSFIDSVQDNQPIQWEITKPLSRSAPIYSYASSGPRTVQVTLNLHRDLMQDINRNVSNIGDIKGVELDYIDAFIKYIQAATLPDYQATSKVVNPPIVSLKLGNDIFIKGVISSNLGLVYKYPILSNGRFAEVQINLGISEIDPYSARDVIYTGSYRSVNISTTLDRKDYNLYGSPNPSTNLDEGRAITNNEGFGGRAGGGAGRRGDENAPIGSGNTGSSKTINYSSTDALIEGAKALGSITLDQILNSTTQQNEGVKFRNTKNNIANYDNDLKEKNPTYFGGPIKYLADNWVSGVKDIVETVGSGYGLITQDIDNTNNIISSENAPNKYYSYDNNLKEKNSMYFKDPPSSVYEYSGTENNIYPGDAPDTYYNN